MSSMTDNETYNGYANRETWAFNLHWQNDQGLYNQTLYYAREYLGQASAGSHNPISDSEIGEFVVNHWREMIEHVEAGTLDPNDTLRMMNREVGSWWRIDYREVGEAVRESLDAES